MVENGVIAFFGIEHVHSTVVHIDDAG